MQELKQSQQSISKTQGNTTCQICTKSYSDQLLPMILCDNKHSICSSCVQDISKKNSQCPFCKQAFNVKNLKVNHGIQFKSQFGICPLKHKFSCFLTDGVQEKGPKSFQVCNRCGEKTLSVAVYCQSCKCVQCHKHKIHHKDVCEGQPKWVYLINEQYCHYCCEKIRAHVKCQKCFIRLCIQCQQVSQKINHQDICNNPKWQYSQTTNYCHHCGKHHQGFIKCLNCNLNICTPCQSKLVFQ